MAATLAGVYACTGGRSNVEGQVTSQKGGSQTPFFSDANKTAQKLVDDGRQIFRFDTYGDEAFWTGQLHIQQSMATLSPRTALDLGLKVDADALSDATVSAIQAGQVNLDDAAVTLQLLKANAVLGVVGTFGADGALSAVGFTCALCHSTVDDRIAPGIGTRIDGIANRDLDVGAIIATAPNLQPVVDLLKLAEPTITDPVVRTVLKSWGPGKFDAELFLDGKAFQPDGRSAATLLPNARGLAGHNLHTWTGGWGTVSYWNALVASSSASAACS
jgi:hypothetical protein